MSNNQKFISQIDASSRDHIKYTHIIRPVYMHIKKLVLKLV